MNWKAKGERKNCSYGSTKSHIEIKWFARTKWRKNHVSEWLPKDRPSHIFHKLDTKSRRENYIKYSHLIRNRSARINKVNLLFMLAFSMFLVVPFFLCGARPGVCGQKCCNEPISRNKWAAYKCRKAARRTHSVCGQGTWSINKLMASKCVRLVR